MPVGDGRGALFVECPPPRRVVGLRELPTRHLAVDVGPQHVEIEHRGADQVPAVLREGLGGIRQEAHGCVHFQALFLLQRAPSAFAQQESQGATSCNSLSRAPSSRSAAGVLPLRRRRPAAPETAAATSLRDTFVGRGAVKTSV